MPKMRGIKPETWTDEKIVSVSPLARLLFIGMWNYACDNGHVDDSPVQLKMRILPADNCNPAELIAELVDAGLLVRKDGYLKAENLPEHQKIDLRYLTLCSHCEHDGQARFSAEDRSTRTPGKGTDTAGTRRAPTVRPVGTRVEGEGEGEGRTDTSAKADTFVEFWSIYPRRDAKRKAEQAYRSALKRAKADVIIAGAKRYRDDPARKPQYTAMPATWLNGDRWDDGALPAEVRPLRAVHAQPGGIVPPSGGQRGREW